MVTFICYPKCTTCQRAQKWLEEHGVEYTMRNIKEDKPSYEELSAWYAAGGLPLRDACSQGDGHRGARRAAQPA